MKKLLILILIASAIPALAQTAADYSLTESSPESAKMSSERLKKVDKVLQNCIDQKWMNGAAALIVRNGKIVYYKSFGYDDIGNKNLLAKDAIFRIASQTKAITSVAVMMLFEDGKLLLDDPISKYIPEFSNQQVLESFNPRDTTYTTVPATRQVTIRDLLTHTSGIGYAEIGSPEAVALYAKSKIICGLGFHNHLLSDDIKKLGKLPLFHQPGEKFTYGLNVDVLGYLVEVLSGMSLDAFFRERIFAPLGIKDTYFYLPESKFSRLVNLYIAGENGVLRKSPGYFYENGVRFEDYPKEKGTYFAGGAGLSSTMMDYAIFLQMLLNGGEYHGHRILSRNTVRMMTTNQIGQLNHGPHKFGLGFELVTKDSEGILPVNEGTFSWGGAFSTTYWVDPKEKIVGLMYRQLWNDQHENELINKFKVLVYQAIAD